MRNVDHNDKEKRLDAYGRIKPKYSSTFHLFTIPVGEDSLIPAIFTIHSSNGDISCAMGVMDENLMCSIVSQKTLDVFAALSPSGEEIHMLQFSKEYTGNIKKMEQRFNDFDLMTKSQKKRNCMIICRNTSIYDKMWSLFGLDVSYQIAIMTEMPNAIRMGSIWKKD